MSQITEQRWPGSSGLEQRSDETILASLLESQQQALAAVAQVTPQIAAAAQLLVHRLAQGGRLVYAGAGSSFGQGLLDGHELPGTFGLPPEQILFLSPMLHAHISNDQATEDDCEKASRDVSALRPSDTMLAIAASGSTPYTLTLSQQAKAQIADIAIIALVNSPETPLGQIADLEIILASGPEIIAGSTRLAAGTAQKIALNMISTLAMIRSHATHDGLMVNCQASNAKLRQRARTIIQEITGADVETASQSLTRADNNIKQAVLLAAGAKNLDAAKLLLSNHQHHLRAALAELSDQKI